MMAWRNVRPGDGLPARFAYSLAAVRGVVVSGPARYGPRSATALGSVLVKPLAGYQPTDKREMGTLQRIQAETFSAFIRWFAEFA
jgi:hypothetical protein